MKAVIMAGGSGKRLRPLTCTVPKPMARLCGKPVIEHILTLLQNNGFDEACITLGYLADIIEHHFENGFSSMKLSFAREEEPLGTAGSVRNAADGWDETFLVISGDAMCDFNLSELVRLHKQSGALASIVATRVNDPREYGVIMTDSNGRVDGFVEKPSWSQAISGLVNTGIYILEPECLKMIEKGKFLDFSKDIFPLMMQNSVEIGCVCADGYWCDIGNIEAYLQCQRDIFDGKVRIEIPCVSKGIFSPENVKKGDYSIIEPVYIGRDAEISKGCVIGPYAVIDDGAFIDSNSRVRHSVVLENACVASNVSLTGALVCQGASLKNGVSMFEGSVVGAGSVIGENASVSPNCLVWPGKVISESATVNTNVKYGSIKGEMLSDGCVCENSAAYLSPETCLKLGEAVGSTRRKIKAGIGFDGLKASEALSLAVKSGLLSTGACVWDFERCFEAQMNFFTACCGLDCGIFIRSGENRSLKICSEGGLPLTGFFEREIEAKMSRSEFRYAKDDEIGECMQMGAVKMIYRQELLNTAPNGLGDVRAQIRSVNGAVEDTAREAASILNLDTSGGPVFNISESGCNVSAQLKVSVIDGDTLLVICCVDEMKKGNDIAVAYDAPLILDSIADAYNCKVLRYLSAPANYADSDARKLSANQCFVRDGLFTAFKVLSIIKNRNKTLEELVKELPDRYYIRKTVESNVSPTRLAAMFPDDGIKISNKKEGIRLVRENGSLLIVPASGGSKFRVFAESVSAETAQELFDGFEDLRSNLTDDY